MIYVTQIMGAFLMSDEFRRPPLAALLREGALVTEAGRLAAQRSSVRQLRRRTPFARRATPRVAEPVLLIPGFAAGDWTLKPLARSLREEGFRTYRSGINANIGCVMAAAEQIEVRLETIAERRGSKVQLVGHSLGGMISRGIAVRRPDLVAGIVTLGSPMRAPAAHHAVLGQMVRGLSRLSELGVPGVLSADCVGGACAELAYNESRESVGAVPMTNIYSKGDGICDWRACIDPEGRHVEVSGSHVGLVVKPQTIARVHEALMLQSASAPGLALVTTA